MLHVVKMMGGLFVSGNLNGVIACPGCNDENIVTIFAFTLRHYFFGLWIDFCCFFIHKFYSIRKKVLFFVDDRIRFFVP